MEDMILKDNVENRALQDQLEKESVEQEKLAKKLLKKKKMDRRLSDRSTSRLSTDNESVASTGDGEVALVDRGGRWTSLDASFARCFAIF